MSTQTIEYGNWVSAKFIYIPLILGAALVALTGVSPLFIVVSAPFILAAVYFAWARYAFSPRGKDVQSKLWQLVLDHLDWKGKGTALDIGCGNGPLTVSLAQRHPEAQVTGIDYWGGKWEYSQAACEQNAEAAGVAERTTFQKASASSLPFEDGYFDAVVSNNVFHEVADTKDKRELIREALRVLKKGGHFSLQDLFLLEPVYGEIEVLLQTIRDWGITEVSFIDTSASDFVPNALKLPFMVGTCGIIYGTK